MFRLQLHPKTGSSWPQTQHQPVSPQTCCSWCLLWLCAIIGPQILSPDSSPWRSKVIQLYDTGDTVSCRGRSLLEASTRADGHRSQVSASLPGHVAGVTHPALLPLVVAAAGLADVQLAVQTLALGVDQELEGLETPDAVALSQPGLVAQQLSLRVFFLDLCL